MENVILCEFYPNSKKWTCHYKGSALLQQSSFDLISYAWTFLPCRISEGVETLKLEVSTTPYTWENLCMGQERAESLTCTDLLIYVYHLQRRFQSSSLQLFNSITHSHLISGPLCFLFFLWDCGVFPSVESCGLYIKKQNKQKNKPSDESQKIVWVEETECKERQLEWESSRNSIQDLTLKKTVAHVVLSADKARLSTTQSDLFTHNSFLFLLNPTVNFQHDWEI